MANPHGKERSANEGSIYGNVAVSVNQTPGQLAIRLETNGRKRYDSASKWQPRSWTR